MPKVPQGPIDLEQLVTFRLSRLADTLTQAAAQVYGRRFGITLTEWRTLAILSRHQPTTAAEIGRRSRIDKGWISRSLAALEKRGLIERQRHPDDSRSQLLTLTAAGRDLVEAVAPLSQARAGALLAGLTPAERDQFMQWLERIEGQAETILASWEE